MKIILKHLTYLFLFPIMLVGAPEGQKGATSSFPGISRFSDRLSETPPSISEIYSIFAGKSTTSDAIGKNLRMPGTGKHPGRQIHADILIDTVSVPTAITQEIWDTDLNTWINSFRSTFTYDMKANVTGVVHQAWMFIRWENVQKVDVTYDLSNRVINELSHSWSGGLWLKSYQVMFTYAPNGMLSSFTLQLWNGSSWENEARQSYYFDGNDNIVRRHEETWDGSKWVNSVDYSATYDSLGNLLTVLHCRWDRGAWLDVSNYAYTYDGSNRLSTETMQFWDGTQWLNEVRYLSSYDTEGYLFEYIRQNWLASNWKNITRGNYYYDVYGNLTDEYGDEWDGFDWIYDYVSMHIYGPLNEIVESFTQSWTGSQWVNSGKVTYSCETMVTPSEVTQNYSMLSQWNMVSVPLTVSTYNKDVLYPTSVSNAFYFDAGYMSSATLENGRGYWLKFDSAQSVPLTGVVRTEDTVDVVAGWNMVGSIGVPIAAAGVGSIPGGLVTSSFFKFDAGYQASSTIDPGMGYWVKVSAPGKLVYSGTGNIPATARVRMELPDDRPPAPPEEVLQTGIAPLEYTIQQNYPNPFNPVTEIAYSLREGGHVRLSVFNIIGQEVAVLVDGIQEGGHQSVTFDASTHPSGVYFYKLSAGSFSDVRRMVLLK